jgi:hypothetical protein
MRKLIYTMLWLASTAHAQDFSRAMMPGDRERPDYVVGTSQQHWPAGQVNWYYNPSGQPSYLSTATILNAIQVAGARWSGMCNVSFNYMGTTFAAPNLDGAAETVDRTSVFGWGPLLNDRSGYSAYTKWWWMGTDLVDSDVLINNAIAWTVSDLEAIMTHELGHALGISHSDVSASVMFANPYPTAAYMKVLRGDDARACAALYGAATTADSNRAFNWAEGVYSQYLLPSPAASGNAFGYYYRYYPAVNSYIGTKDGATYFMGPDSVIVNVGPVSGYLAQAQSAGY